MKVRVPYKVKVHMVMFVPAVLLKKITISSWIFLQTEGIIRWYAEKRNSNLSSNFDVIMPFCKA